MIARGLALSGGWVRRNRVLAWMCVLIAVNQLGFGSIVPVIPLYAREYGVPQSLIGLAVAVYGLARMVLNVPGGQLADRVGRRPALALGGFVTAVGHAICALAPDYAAFLGGRFVAGAGAALVLTVGQIVLADISTREQRGRVMAIYWGVFLAAVGVGPLPGGILAEQLGLAAPFSASALFGVLTAAVAWFGVPETRDLRIGEAGPTKAPPPFGAQLRLLMANRGFLLVSLVSLANAVTRTGGIFTLIPILGQDRAGLRPDEIGLGLALISVAGLILSYPSGVLVDRFGRKAVLVPSTVLSGAAFAWFLVATSLPSFLIGCILWGVATGISGPAPGAYAADVAPPGMNAAAMSAFRMLSDLGYVGGPLALGLIADLFGADASLLTRAALLIGAALVFGRFAPETYRRLTARRGSASPA